MKVAKFAFSLFGVNTYAVYDPATLKCAIIDPGMIDAEEEEALVNFVKRNNLTVTHVINTHLHIDHAIGDDFAAKAFGAPVLAHEADMFLGVRMQRQAEEFGIAARVSKNAITEARKKGIMVGMIRPITLWPFHEKPFKKAAQTAKQFISVELSMGQMIEDVRLATECRVPVTLCNRTGGMIPSPDMVLEAIEKAAENGGAK